MLHFTAFLYADDSLVALMDPIWLQGAFDTMIGGFDRVGHETNIEKTFSMLCHPCYAVGAQ